MVLQSQFQLQYPVFNLLDINLNLNTSNQDSAISISISIPCFHFLNINTFSISIVLQYFNTCFNIFFDNGTIAQACSAFQGQRGSLMVNWPSGPILGNKGYLTKVIIRLMLHQIPHSMGQLFNCILIRFAN